MDRKSNLAAKEKIELLKQQLELQNKIIGQYKQQLEKQETENTNFSALENEKTAIELELANSAS